MSTVFGTSCVLGLVAIAGVVALGTEQLGHAQQAQTAADLAALSGATVVQTGDGEGCAVAEAIAQANDAELVSCEVQREFVWVGVENKGREAYALAGPIDS